MSGENRNISGESCRAAIIKNGDSMNAVKLISATDNPNQCRQTMKKLTATINANKAETNLYAGSEGLKLFDSAKIRSLCGALAGSRYMDWMPCAEDT